MQSDRSRLASWVRVPSLQLNNKAMTKKLFFDLETTGVMHWKNGIHQIAGCIEIDDAKLHEGSYDINLTRQIYYKCVSI